MTRLMPFKSVSRMFSSQTDRSSSHTALVTSGVRTLEGISFPAQQVLSTWTRVTATRWEDGWRKKVTATAELRGSGSEWSKHRSQRLSPTVRNTTLYSKVTPSRSSACSCRSKVAAPKYKTSTSKRFQDVPSLSSRVSKSSLKKKVCPNKWNREWCNRWKKMKLIRSWRQRDGRMCGRDSKLGTLNPEKLEDSSERVCSQASTSPPARRKKSRLCISSGHVT